MPELADRIANDVVPPGSLRLWWLGQAGFAFKTPGGTVVLVDPYLSDAVERLHGFKRLSLAPMSPEEVRADLVLLTHEHTDHLDPDAVPVIARNNPECRFAGPSGCLPGLDEAGVTGARVVVIEPGRADYLGDVTVHAAPADHGDLSPTAVSLLIEAAGVRVLLTGDTSFRPGLIQPLALLRPHVVIPCINGVFGNMNHIDAAMLVAQLRPKFAIPCHFWTFAEQGAGDPGGFLHACRQHCPDVAALVLKPGEPFTVEAVAGTRGE